MTTQLTLARLREFGITPDRDLGQHFLIDSNVLDVAGRLIDLDPADVVLEVGAGVGVLTDWLARAGGGGARDRDRPPAGAGAARDRGRASQRAAAGGRRPRRRSRRARPRPHRDGRQPALRGGHPGGDDRAAARAAVLRDGAARAGRSLLRRPGDEGLRRALGADPDRLRAAGPAQGLAQRVSAPTQRRLGAGCLLAPRGVRIRGRLALDLAGGARGLRLPPKDAGKRAGAGRAAPPPAELAGLRAEQLPPARFVALAEELL